MRVSHCCIAAIALFIQSGTDIFQIIEATHSSSQRRQIGSAILLLPIADQVQEPSAPPPALGSFRFRRRDRPADTSLTESPFLPLP
ncbi:MAG: hypothetical protein QMD99_23300, partial [Rhizobiaceae bacterium]|nr:hypothetical protein [Rhizobiaceae bacterium]